MNIILIGPPACGKGTQARRLQNEHGIYHLSTGDLFREIVSQKNKLAGEIKSYIDNGKFVPDNLTIELVKNKLSEIKSYKDVLFDGFPRTVAQAKELEKLIKIDYIIEISVSENTIIDRVLCRAFCNNCGKDVILENPTKNICPYCGSKIVRRSDDTAQIAKARYQDYLTKTYPIISYYKNHKGYYKVNGEAQMDEVYSKICEILKK